ncbi:hypothetical protein Tco_0896626 [Tanacetum coccineum]
MVEDGKIKIDKFDGHDFRQALGAVRLSLAKNVAYNVVSEKTTYDLFKALSNMLMSVDIKFDDEVQALLLPSSLPESWSCTVTAISGSTETTKLKFDNIRDLILREDIHRKTSGEYSNSLLSAKDKDRGRKQDRGQKQNRGISKSKKRGSGKVRLADDKTLDIAGIGDVVLKTSSGTSWTLKDVSLVVARGNKRGSMYMLKVPSDEINASIDSRGNTALWHQRLAYMSEKGMKILASKGRIPDLQKAVVGLYVYGPTSVASICGSRYYVTYIDDSIRKENMSIERKDAELEGAPKMFWEDSVTTAAYLINRGPSVPLGFRIPEDEWQGKEVSLTHLRVFGCDSYVKMKDVARDKLDAKSVKGPKTVRASRIVEDHIKKTMKTEHPSRREAPRLHSYKDSSESPGIRVKEEQYGKKRVSNRNKGGFLVSWERRKPRMQVEEKSVRIKASTETMLSQEFKMKDLGLAKQILGMSVIRDKMKGTLRLFDV